MRIRGFKIFIFISLLVSACSSTDSQTGERTTSDETTRTSISQATGSTDNKNTDTSSSGRAKNDEMEISQSEKSAQYFKDFSSNFTEGNSKIDRAHPFQTLDSFCTSYPPVKEEIVPATVQVEKGDSLAKIASKYDLTLKEILDMNNIANPNLIFIGQEIRVGE